MGADFQAALRQLPKIDTVLARPEVRAIAAPRWAVVEAVRREVEDRRRAILDIARSGGQTDLGETTGQVTARAIKLRVAELVAPSLRRVINATGVVLHTNLGRAPLAPAVMARAAELATSYSNLEYDLDRGRRGSRHGHLVSLLTRLTGAEDAVVVNNNAGAVMLGLSALAAGHEVVVSRGELIEIGGSFRIPDVMRLSGANLVEVGTTNKTHASDYREAVGENTGLLLKVHRSNFAIVGFSDELDCEELARVGRESGVSTMMDLGSGALLSSRELVAMGLAAEPSVAETLSAGIDVVTFSGDKLLGGPQAGIVCGRSELVERVRKHPLMRALRPDKMTICALAATLELYRDGRGVSAVPAMAMMSASPDSLRARAEAMRARLVDSVASALPFDIAVVSCESRVGGGAMPLVALPSYGLGLRPHPGSRLGVDDVERAVRSASVPVIGRIVDDQLILDLRTVLGSDEEGLQAAIAAIARG